MELKNKTFQVSHILNTNLEYEKLESKILNPNLESESEKLESGI